MRIQTRVSEELGNKIEDLIRRLSLKADRGMEVSSSSITRSALSEFVENVEKEENDVVTVDIPLNDLSPDEISTIQNALMKVSRDFMNRRGEENPIIKEDEGNTECYLESQKIKSIDNASDKIMKYHSELTRELGKIRDLKDKLRGDK